MESACCAGVFTVYSTMEAKIVPSDFPEQREPSPGFSGDKLERLDKGTSFSLLLAPSSSE